MLTGNHQMPFNSDTARVYQLQGAEAKKLGNKSFPQIRLVRVRKQLNRLDEMMMTENDAQKLDRIASAAARLAEQERQLAGRPMPGSLRPRSEKDTRRRGGKSDLSDAG
jgi:hypothetical protein